MAHEGGGPGGGGFDVEGVIDAVALMTELGGLALAEVVFPAGGGPGEPQGDRPAGLEVRHRVALHAPLGAAASDIIQAAGQARKGERSDPAARSRAFLVAPGRVLVLMAPEEEGVPALQKVASWVEGHLAICRDLRRERAGVEALGEGLIVVDGAGIVTACTRRAAALLGVEPERVEGRPVFEVLDALPRRLEPSEVARGALGPSHPELGYLMQHLAPGPDGRERAGLVVKLRHEEHFARQRKAYLGFLSALRHDVRSPLTALRGLVSVLQEEPDMPESERAGLIALLKQEAERTVTWVEDYLVILRLRFDPRPAQLVAIPVETLVADLTRRFEAHARDRRIALVQEPTGAGPGLVVSLDPGLLEPLCNNLLGHVLRLGDAGAEVGVGLDPERGALVIRGRGPGLFASHPAEAFTTLARSTASGKRTPGVGLGLFLVKKIADVHGWQISAQVVRSDGELPELRLTLDWSARPIAPSGRSGAASR